MNAPYGLKDKIAAWAVHAFTASGMVVGFYALIAVSQNNLGLAFALLGLTAIIDGVDGSLARKFKVEEVIPWMSGKTMDTVIDFSTYAIIPAYIMYVATRGGIPLETGGSYLLPEAWRGVLIAIVLLSSTLYYGKKGMISDDLYFVGFPMLWNMIAFYLYYVLALHPFWNALLILIFAILHFVPIKYVYPSRTRQYQSWNLLMSVMLLGSNFVLLMMREGVYFTKAWLYPMRAVSLISVVYFAVLSIYLSYATGTETKSRIENQS